MESYEKEVICKIGSTSYDLALPSTYEEFQLAVRDKTGIRGNFLLELGLGGNTRELLPHEVNGLPSGSVIHIKPQVKWFELREETVECLQETTRIIRELRMHATDFMIPGNPDVVSNQSLVKEIEEGFQQSFTSINDTFR
eukprot:TRINITY_DN3004_c0_g1_i13.p1 TRINITY_DN3004_c0_g1~~TRINITY_DN3004_c0_g1_i13.p1  ORF type:complete len:160 (+),score=29.86 TRINITY_DN3004_c0_g1_i13:61-480(+)